MIEIIPVTERERWDAKVRSFAAYDIYYLSGYAKAFQRHGDGDPLLLYYETDGLRAACAVMKRDIAQHGTLGRAIPARTFFDYATPYGYGGFIFDGDVCGEHLEVFREELERELIKENVVSFFVRFHPQLDNAGIAGRFMDVSELGRTVEIRLASRENILSDMSATCRNKIRKALRAGIKVGHGSGNRLFDRFMEIYNITMDRRGADAWYYFTPEFYASVMQHLPDNHEIFYVRHNGDIIAMALFIFANGRMHYHLSGSLAGFSAAAPMNLILYEAALWGLENGFSTLHLGGGAGSADDSLLRFKEGFNRTSSLRFAIGRQILLPDAYRRLTEIRTANDAAFDGDSRYFPLYRA